MPKISRTAFSLDKLVKHVGANVQKVYQNDVNFK